MLDQDGCCSVVNRTATAGNVVSAYLRYIDCIFTSEFSRTATDVLGKGDCSEGRRQEKLQDQMNRKFDDDSPNADECFWTTASFYSPDGITEVGTTTDLNISNSHRSLGTCQGIHRIHYGS